MFIIFFPMLIVRYWYLNYLEKKLQNPTLTYITAIMPYIVTLRLSGVYLQSQSSRT